MAKSSVKRGAIVLFNNSDTFTRRLVRRGSTLRPNGRCDRLVLAKCAGYGAVAHRNRVRRSQNWRFHVRLGTGEGGWSNESMSPARLAGSPRM
jgi:hypothetical protein